jgi:hypothetical protein
MYLTHSDQFTPGLMQATKNITYSNVDPNFQTVPSTSTTDGITVSGRNSNWMDHDGTVTGLFPGNFFFFFFFPFFSFSFFFFFSFFSLSFFSHFKLEVVVIADDISYIYYYYYLLYYLFYKAEELILDRIGRDQIGGDIIQSVLIDNKIGYVL